MYPSFLYYENELFPSEGASFPNRLVFELNRGHKVGHLGQLDFPVNC